MTSWALGLLTLLTSVLLLGATAATWSNVTTATMVDELKQEVVIEQTTSISGAEVAGGLLLVALVAMVIAGLMVRWPLVGLTLIVLGAAALFLIWRGWPTSEQATAAPAIAAVCGMAYLVLAGMSARLPRTSSAPAVTEVGDHAPSRYTVEAVRNETADDDEWNLAVADDGNEDAQ